MDISIIIPTYKSQSYIVECLDSVIAQTLDNVHYEILVVLNGEKEPYWSRLQAYKNAHSDIEIRLLYSAESGVSHARNIGLDEANGKYICFVDDDDIITPTFLEALLSHATEDTISLSNLFAFEHGTNILQPIYISSEFLALEKDVKLKTIRRNLYTVWGKLIHRNIIQDRRFDTSLQNGEDSQFMLLISDRIKSASFTDANAQYHYRQRHDSAFNKKKKCIYYIQNFFIRSKKAITIYISNPSKYSLQLFIMYIFATLAGNIRQLMGISQIKTKHY